MKKIFTLLLVVFFTALSSANNSGRIHVEAVTCPTAFISYPNVQLCVNSPNQMVILTGSDNYLGGTYSSSTGLTINPTTGTITPSTSLPGTYLVTYTLPVVAGCTEFTQALTQVVIGNLPTASISSGYTICSGSSANINFSGNPNATVVYNVNGGSNQTVLLSPSGFANINTGALYSTTVYNLVSVSITPECSQNISGSATISVSANQAPVLTATYPSSICSGAMTNIVLNSTQPNTTYNWNVVQIGVTGGNSGTNTSGIINYTISGSIYNPGQIIFNVTPVSNNGCQGIPFTIPIEVYPIPSVTSTPSNQTINSGQATNIVLSSSVAGTTYSWTSTSSNVTGASAGSGNTISQILTLNNTSLSGLVTYTVTPNKNGCYGNPIDVVVTVNPNLGTNDFDSQNFIVSPNPVIDILNIKNNQTINRVTAFNQLGQVVLQKEYNTNEVQLDFSGLKTGIYFIAVDSDKKQSTFKIVKN